MFVHKKGILLFSFLFASAAIMLIFYLRELRKYQSGNLIELIDLLPEPQTIKEALTADWVKVVALNRQTDIWKTHSRFLISTSATPHLFSNDHELIVVSDIFGSDITPGHWSWSGEDVWIAFPSGQSPVPTKLFLEYETRSSRLISQREPLEKPQNIPAMSSSSRAVFLYQTKYQTLACNRNQGISVHAGWKQVNGAQNLLEEERIKNGWTRLDGAHYTLLDVPFYKRIVLDGPQNVYKNTRFYTSGIVRFTFVASTRSAGKTRLPLGIQLDDRKLGLLRIASNQSETYSVQAYVHEGDHTLRAEFIRSSILKLQTSAGSAGTSALQQQDQPVILLSQAQVDYVDAIVVASQPGAAAQQRYSVQYCTPENRITSESVDLHGDARSAFVLTPSSRAVFRVKLPEHARLTFSLGYLSPPNSDRSATRVVVNIKPFLGKRENVFSFVPQQDLWSEQTVDLNAFSGKRVKLEFVAFPTLAIARWTPRIGVANPLIFSQSLSIKKEPSNIFIVTADALRADHLGSYGYGRPTSPNIDLFAKDAVLFENAVSQGAATLPSTSSLFTSVYPSMHKTDYNTSKLAQEFFTLPEIMRAHQYMTGGFVQNEFLNPAHGLADGFLWYRYDTFPWKTEERLKNVLDWIENMQHFPMFVFFHMLHPHSPYVPPDEFAQIFNVSQMPLASSNEKLSAFNASGSLLNEKDREQLITLYDAEIRHLDSMFGDFIQKLKQLHLYDEALIVFLSDHGEGFQEHGFLLHGTTVYQNMIHVPFIVKFPASSKLQGIRISDFVQTMDLAPTILEFSKLPPPQYMQGKSLLRLLPGHSKSQAEAPIYSEVLSADILCVIKGGFKYVYFGKSHKEELYDLKNDPDETKNVAAGRPDLLKTFRADRSAFLIRAAQWQEKYALGGEKIRLDENQKEQLRALGYVH